MDIMIQADIQRAANKLSGACSVCSKNTNPLIVEDGERWHDRAVINNLCVDCNISYEHTQIVELGREYFCCAGVKIWRKNNG